MEKIAFSLTSNEYSVKVAAKLEEACPLLEVGFEYVTEIDGSVFILNRSVFGHILLAGFSKDTIFCGGQRYCLLRVPEFP